MESNGRVFLFTDWSRRVGDLGRWLIGPTLLLIAVLVFSLDGARAGGGGDASVVEGGDTGFERFLSNLSFMSERRKESIRDLASRVREARRTGDPESEYALLSTLLSTLEEGGGKEGETLLSDQERSGSGLDTRVGVARFDVLAALRNVTHDLGDYERMRAVSREQIALGKALLGRTEEWAWAPMQNELGRALASLSLAEQSLSAPDRAWTAMVDSVERHRLAVDGAPGDLRWRQGLVFGLTLQMMFLFDQGDVEAARAVLAEGEAAAREALAMDPKEPESLYRLGFLRTTAADRFLAHGMGDAAQWKAIEGEAWLRAVPADSDWKAKSRDSRITGLLTIAIVERRLGYPHQAIGLYEDLRALMRQAWGETPRAFQDRSRMATALFEEALAYSDLTDYETAQVLMDKAERYYEGLAASEPNDAWWAEKAKKAKMALDDWRRKERATRAGEGDEPRAVVLARRDLERALFAAERNPTGNTLERVLLQAALSHNRVPDDEAWKKAMAWAFGQSGLLARRSGDLERAIHDFSEAMGVYAMLETPLARDDRTLLAKADVLYGLGRTRMATGQLDQARQAFREGLAVADAYSPRATAFEGWSIAKLRLILGLITLDTKEGIRGKAAQGPIEAYKSVVSEMKERGLFVADLETSVADMEKSISAE